MNYHVFFWGPEVKGEPVAHVTAPFHGGIFPYRIVPVRIHLISKFKIPSEGHRRSREMALTDNGRIRACRFLISRSPFSQSA